MPRNGSGDHLRERNRVKSEGENSFHEKSSEGPGGRVYALELLNGKFLFDKFKNDDKLIEIDFSD